MNTYPTNHWSYDPFRWDMIDASRQIDSGLLFFPSNDYSQARASLGRVLRATFKHRFAVDVPATQGAITGGAVLDDGFAASTFIVPHIVFGAITFRGTKSYATGFLTFALRSYDEFSTFSAGLVANPFVPLPSDALAAFDTLFARLADERLWRWDSRLTMPIRRTPHLSWNINRVDRELLDADPLVCSVLSVNIPASFTNEQEQAFARRLHACTVGRIPVLNYRKNDGLDNPRFTLVKDMRLCPAWSSSDTPTITLPADATEEDMRVAIIDLRSMGLDFTAASFPTGFLARAFHSAAEERLFEEKRNASATTTADPVISAQELADLQKNLERANAEVAALRSDLINARSARDRFRSLVHDLRTRIPNGNDADDARDDSLDTSAQEEGPLAISTTPTTENAPPTLPSDWRDADSLLAYLQTRYGPRIVMHPRARAALADAPTTVDESALADILDILGTDYLALIDGDPLARRRYLTRKRRYKAGRGITASGAGVVRGYDFSFEGEKIDPTAIRKLRERGRSMSGRAVCVYFIPLRDKRLLLVSLPRHLQTVDS